MRIAVNKSYHSSRRHSLLGYDSVYSKFIKSAFSCLSDGVLVVSDPFFQSPDFAFKRTLYVDVSMTTKPKQQKGTPQSQSLHCFEADITTWTVGFIADITPDNSLLSPVKARIELASKCSGPSVN